MRTTTLENSLRKDFSRTVVANSILLHQFGNYCFMSFPLNRSISSQIQLRSWYKSTPILFPISSHVFIWIPSFMFYFSIYWILFLFLCWPSTAPPFSFQLLLSISNSIHQFISVHFRFILNFTALFHINFKLHASIPKVLEIFLFRLMNWSIPFKIQLHNFTTSFHFNSSRLPFHLQFNRIITLY